MNIAVLSLTRDRLEYTKTCFESLRHNAGCDFDWYVLDQGSTDGTAEWLRNYGCFTGAIFGRGNIGICRGLNKLVDYATNSGNYDVIVGFDNDCYVTTTDTLADVAAMAYAYPAILSPHILGLRNTPQPLGHTDGITEVFQIGNIFRAVPAEVFTEFGYRFDETNPPWGGDEAICLWFRERGGVVGYLDGYEAWHMDTTEGQAKKYPEYFRRRVLEGGPAL